MTLVLVPLGGRGDPSPRALRAPLPALLRRAELVA